MNDEPENTSLFRRLLARHRLEVRYWDGWVSTRRGGRQIGPRPALALHRLPDPHCTTCGGQGEVEYGSPFQDEPGYDDCHCSPFLPLALIWLPRRPAWTRRPAHPSHDPWCADPNCTHTEAPV
ncbi:hypothetical protein [Streptomyces agglomeratus]|uniref:hypothetical protein n=1 Tax=Streptomyces agglomeratus TaxID=285458 RepID=UPI000854A01D|nr:hypothetical protein [Streptomyces agglomeratus]OEJ52617.1 hypothetical protein BGK72_19440 [Streptomyces agglomeratus]